MGLFHNSNDFDIDAAQAHRLAAEENAVLLDVREPGEWAAGHAPDAVHMPLGSLDTTALPADRPVVAVCRSGARSSRAAEALRTAGIDARNLSGGMSAWASSGLPVVRDDGQAGTVA